jgi:hypothetical protein
MSLYKITEVGMPYAIASYQVIGRACFSELGSRCLLEKSLGRLHIPLLARAWNQRDCHRGQWRDTNNITSHARVLVRFIDRAGWSCLSIPLGPQLIRYQWGKSCFPISDGLMGVNAKPRSKNNSATSRKLSL